MSIATTSIRDTAWCQFYALVEKLTGVNLYHYNEQQTNRRILTTAEAFGHASLEELAQAMEESALVTEQFLDRLAINVTSCFRNPSHWEVLEREILPELLHLRLSVSCWSAGCSSGEEAYSLAALLADASAGHHSIWATDIDRNALRAANTARFSADSVQEMPARLLNRYFEEVEPGSFAAKPVLRDLVRFEHRDLFEPMPAASFDLILCRNVLIYFSEPAKETLCRQFYQALNPGGYLFLGASERILDPESLGYLNPRPYFYRKPF